MAMMLFLLAAETARRRSSGVTDPMGHTTSYDPDDLGRPKSVAVPGAVGIFRDVGA